MGKRGGGPGSKLPKAEVDTENTADALELSSESEQESDEESGLPEETDSEAGLPSDVTNSDEEGYSDEDASERDELDQALLNVLGSPSNAAHAPQGKVPKAETNPAQATSIGEERDSDSSEDERIPRNTVGSVPLAWYSEEGHIGYGREGEQLLKQDKEQQGSSVRDKDKWRTIYDEYNDEQITLSKEEIGLIQRIRQGRFPHIEVNPFEPEADWFTKDEEIHPLSSAPEPKRRFMPSKWEEKKIVKLVRALRKGWIKREEDKPKEPETYLLWGDGGSAMQSTATGLTYIPATKARLPGHEESYNPPQEYLPTEAEKLAADEGDEGEPEYVPQAFDALRKVPAYERFIKERFERCLDLYLCPRARRKRAFVKDPETLVPKLPKPQDLQPFPTSLLLHFRGHQGVVQAIAPSPSGQWLASASADGTAKVWEVSTGRCLKTWQLGGKVKSVAWCPNPQYAILAVASGHSVLLLLTGLGTEEAEAASGEMLQPLKQQEAAEKVLCRWQTSSRGEGLELMHQFPVQHVSWHGRGDYFTSVAPSGSNQAILVHQLSRKATQNPFRKNKGKAVRAAFHPSKPFFFVATQNSVRVYNLAKQELSKKLVSGSAVITSIAVHPSGDHIIVGSENNRLAWYDLDLSTKPYRSLRYHQHALQAVAYHRTYPLFASASDDGTVHVFHGMVYQDLLTNPLIVPVKVLRGHTITDCQGVTDCAFHPTQPWLFSSGADGLISLFTN